MSEADDTEDEGMIRPGVFTRIRAAAKLAFRIVLALGLLTLILWLCHSLRIWFY